MFQPSSSSQNVPQLFAQEELNDLVRDLGSSKDRSEILGSRLKDINTCLTPGTTFYWYRNRESEFVKYFEQHEPIVYYKNAAYLIISFGASEYKPVDCRLFIDSSKRSLKTVLLHNGNIYASVPVGHSTKLKENYDILEEFFKRIKIL